MVIAHAWLTYKRTRIDAYGGSEARALRTLRTAWALLRSRRHTTTKLPIWDTAFEQKYVYVRGVSLERAYVHSEGTIIYAQEVV